MCEQGMEDFFADTVNIPLSLESLSTLKGEIKMILLYALLYNNRATSWQQTTPCQE